MIFKNGDTKCDPSTDTKLSFHTSYFPISRELPCNLKTYLNCIFVTSSITLWDFYV